jgi:hypothetical protein
LTNLSLFERSNETAGLELRLKIGVMNLVIFDAESSNLIFEALQVTNNMNKKKLKQAERDFLTLFPAGFDDPEMVTIGKKHRVDKMTDLAQSSFTRAHFETPEWIVESMIKIVGRSSMVSMFEKPKFRDFMKMLPGNERDMLVNGFEKLLHGKQQAGFETMLSVMQSGKLAKWSLMTILPVYFSPQEEVFVKPTTAKGVIKYFELESLDYKPLPSWDFYRIFRESILEMRSMVDASLAPNNAAFTGFLMMSMGRT